MKGVIKAVKKLKLWSKKIRKKKRHEHEHDHEAYYPPPPPPPCPCHHCCYCSSSSSTQPSAPPLPASSSWLEAEHNYGTFLTPREEAYASETHPQEIAMDSCSPVYPILAVSTTSSTSSPSYHQCMVSVSEPVYGIPVPLIQTARRERSSQQFGCVLSFGAYLFRCLCPCFHLREVV